MHLKNIHGVWNSTRSRNLQQHITRFWHTPCVKVKRHMKCKTPPCGNVDDLHGPCISTVYNKKMATRSHNTNRVSSTKEPCLIWNQDQTYTRMKTRRALRRYSFPERHTVRRHAVCPRRAMHWITRIYSCNNESFGISDSYNVTPDGWRNLIKLKTLQSTDALNNAMTINLPRKETEHHDSSEYEDFKL